MAGDKQLQSTEPLKKAEDPVEKNKAEGSESKDGQRKLPQLGALEDDDEFEDFPESAENSGNVLDAMKKAGNDIGDNMWEDNWDDDDDDDDFTKQLRTAIAERNGVADETMKE